MSTAQKRPALLSLKSSSPSHLENIPGWHQTRSGPRFVCYKAPRCEKCPSEEGDYTPYHAGKVIPKPGQIWVEKGTSYMFVLTGEVPATSIKGVRYILVPYLTEKNLKRMTELERANFSALRRIISKGQLHLSCRVWPEYVATIKRLGMI